MIVEVPHDAAVECWAVGVDGRRLGSSAGGPLEVPDGSVLEVRGRGKARCRLAWLADTGALVMSVDVRRSRAAERELLAAAELPGLALLTASGDGVTAAAVAAIAAAPGLAVLQLSGEGLGSGDLEPLRRATRLRQVRLSVPGVPAAEVLDVLARRSLGAFGLTEPRVSSDVLARVVARWPLREFSIALDVLDGRVIDDVAGLRSLTRLAIDATRLDVIAEQVSTLVCRLPGLTSLDLTEDGIQVDPGLVLAGWRQRPGLRINGLAMGPATTARFVDRWPSATD